MIFSEAIERAGERKGLERLLVYRPGAEPLSKVKNVGIIPMRITLYDDRFHSSITGTFYCTQSETDGAVLVHFEINTGFIDVRPKHFDPHFSAFFDKKSDVFEIAL